MATHLGTDEGEGGLGVRGDLRHVGDEAVVACQATQPVGEHRPFVRRQGDEELVCQLAKSRDRGAGEGMRVGRATTSESTITTWVETSAGTMSQRPREMSVSPWRSRFIAGWAKFWLDSSSWMPGRVERISRARAGNQPVRGDASEGDAAEADLAFVGGAHRRRGVAYGLKNRARWAINAATARRQRDRTGVAVEQPRAQFALQLLDGPAQRRLRHVKSFGGATEVQFLGHGEECP